MRQFEIFHRFKRFDRIWCRLSRSVPIIGVLTGFVIRRERLEEKKEEDGRYQCLVESTEANISFSRYSVLREKAIIKGELLGHVIAVSIGVLFYLLLPFFRIVFSTTWALAFVADWIGGKITGSLFDQKEADCRPNYLR